MESQYKKARPSDNGGSNADAVLQNYIYKGPIPGKTKNAGVQREKTRHLNLLANTNILGFRPGEYVILPTRIGPDKLIENRPAWVEFELWNRAGVLLTDVFVRARITANQSVNDYNGAFEFPIKRLEVGQVIQGAISFTLPRADLANKVTVELCQWGEIPPGGEFPPLNVLTFEELEFDVAAKFSINMSGIFIRETASRHEDTVVVSFSGLSGNTSWSDVSHLGDHNNTPGRSGISPEVFPVGPFDMLPGGGNNITVSCTVANAGHTSTEEDAKRALTIVSKVGEITAATVLSIIFPFGAGVWTGLAAATNELHLAILDYAFADCDTVVLRDFRFITEADLFGFTNDPHDQKTEDAPVAWVMRSQKKVGKLPKLTDDEPELPLGDGCRDSDYSTGLSVKRHRTPEMFHTYYTDGIQLSPGQEASFGPIGHNTENVVFSHEGKGGLTPTGVFKAPLTTTDRKYSIVKWKVLQENKKGLFTAYEDFSIVLLD